MQKQFVRTHFNIYFAEIISIEVSKCGNNYNAVYFACITDFQGYLVKWSNYVALTTVQKLKMDSKSELPSSV